MSEQAAYYRELHHAVRQRGEDRRKMATTAFDAARKRADEAGLSLVRHSDIHYTLNAGKARYDIFPGNRRVKKGKDAPYLLLPDGWTLCDVVNAASAAIREGGR